RWPLDTESLSWQATGREVRVSFPVGTDRHRAVAWVRAAVTSGQVDPAIRAVVDVLPEGRAGPKGGAPLVLVRVREPQRPPDHWVAEQHRVACVLYEKPAAVIGEVPRV
ncbi:MAG TPA: hypothetical protein VII27_05330, partial [Thermoplasmata archaeon]